MSLIKKNPKKAKEFLRIRDNNICAFCDENFLTDDEVSIVSIEVIKTNTSNKNLDTSKLVHNRCNVLLQYKTPIESYEQWIAKKAIFQKEVYSKELKEDIFKQIEHLNFPVIVQEKIVKQNDKIQSNHSDCNIKQFIQGRDFCGLNNFENSSEPREILAEIQVTNHAYLRAHERFNHLTEELLKDKLKTSFNIGIVTKDGLELWKSGNIVYFLKPLGLVNCKPAIILIMTVMPYEIIKRSLNEALISQRSRKYKKVEKYRKNLDDIIQNLHN